MGVFNPESFLDATLNEPNSTVSIPCPEGEYIALALDEPKIRTFEGKKESNKGVQYISLDIDWTIEDPAVMEVTQRKPTKVRQSLMLDLTENGALDMGKGKNIGLGRLREAVGLNKPGQAFSFRQLQGRQARVRVTHRVVEDRIYDEIKSVASAG